ncbi:MAG TPA: hypothetical protein VEM38_02815 [Burkholderiales bacterium]|nr:hypothetical protein [Burkholderiales bacterium]
MENKTMKAGVVALLELALVGCAAVPTDVSLLQDSAIPSLSVIKDEFDGSAIVQQVPVSSSSSLAEGWHALGFEWHQKTPEIIFVTAGAIGSVTLTDLAFNADGELISRIKPASAGTEYGSSSTRRFAMSWQDFLKIANAKSVKMKLVRLDEYTVSSFGPEHPEAVVNTRIAPFVEKVRELRSSAGGGR